MNTLRLSGKSDAKGRNGYYKLASIDLWNDGHGIVFLDFMSKRGTPSSRVELTPEDYHNLRKFLSDNPVP